MIAKYIYGRMRYFSYNRKSFESFFFSYLHQAIIKLIKSYLQLADQEHLNIMHI